MDDAVRDEVRGWLLKAAHDLASARKLAAEPDPYLDTAIYHCQQAAEKAVKGWLTFHSVRFDKTHDVRDLIAQAAETDSRFNTWLEAGQVLTPYAAAFRYPDEPLMPDRAEFDEAFRHAEGLLVFTMSTLPADVLPPPQ
jgi:HEPN domain-containing protein